MKKLCGTVCVVTALAGGALLLPGCEDPAAKARDEVQSELTAAADEFQVAVLTQAGAMDDAGRSELRGILNQLTSATSNPHAGAGQKSAASLLAADIHRVLADAQLDIVDELRTEQRAQRLAVYSMVSSAARMQSIAAAVESGTVEEQVTTLTDARTEAEDALRQEQAAIAQLEQPISELEAQITEARADVSELRTEENQLRRQAAELGYFQGFETYEQAIAVRQQADEIETSSSYRELSRDYEYVPVRAMHEQRIEQIEGAIESIDLAIEELRANASASAELAMRTRQALDEQMADIDAEVVALSNRLENDLKPAVETASEDLTAAANKAEQAANAQTTGGTSARVTAAAANSSLGQLHAAWAFEQEQHAALLERLSASDLPGTSGKYGSQIESAEQAHAEAVENALSAFNEASTNFGRLSGDNANAGLALQHEVEVSIAALKGEAAPESPDFAPPPTTPQAPATSQPGRSASAGQGGAESPEALASALMAMDTPREFLDWADYQIPIEHVNFDSQNERELATLSIEALKASRNLMTALEDQFGASGPQAMGLFTASMSTTMITVTNASVTSTNGDRATLSLTTSDGTTQSANASRIGGRWYLGTPEDFSGGMHAMSPQQGMDNPEFMQGMLQGMRASVDAMNSIAQRVRAGEFSSPDQVEAAFNQAIQEAMGSLMQQ